MKNDTNLHPTAHPLLSSVPQRGAAAAEAVNVYYYLTYEGAVSLDDITDPDLRLATEARLRNAHTRCYRLHCALGAQPALPPP